MNMEIIYKAVVCGSRENAFMCCRDTYSRIKRDGRKNFKMIRSTNTIEEWNEELSYKVITEYISLRQNVDGKQYRYISVDESAIVPGNEEKLLSVIKQLMVGQMMHA